MLSTLTVIPYRAAFDGNDVPMTGVGGTWRLLERGENLREAIERIDRKWQSRYNCMVRCEDIEYAWIGRANPFADRSYTYVYFREDGEPSAYLTCRPGDDAARTLECTRFVFDDSRGLCGLLVLLKTFEADHSEAVMTLPEDVELSGVLPEWSMGGVRWSSPGCGAKAASSWRSATGRSPGTMDGSGCALCPACPMRSRRRGSRRTSFWAFRISVT